MKFKFFPAVMALLLASLLSSCVDNTRIVQSSEPPLNVESTISIEESEPRENWQEKFVYDNEIVTYQYINFGTTKIKTIEKFNFVDVLIYKDEYILENNIPIKKTFWEYRDDGFILKKTCEELKKDGTYQIVIEQNNFENDMYSLVKYIYNDDSCKTLLSESSIYKSISNEKTLIEKKTGRISQNGYDYSTEMLTYYKDDEIHHHSITKTSLNDESSEYSILDADKNNIITYYYTKDKQSQSIRCYREDGFIQVDITESLLTYYESNDGVTKIFVGKVKINPETGKQNASEYNKETYTAREANRIMEKYKSLYDSAIEFSSDVDYIY